MGRWTQRYRDPGMLEERRLGGVTLLHQGLSQVEVARRLGVTPQAVYYWTQLEKSGGSGAVKAQPHTGRPTRLTSDQIATLPDILAKGPMAYGYQTDLWTTERIADIIGREWGVRYTTVGVWKILKAHGFSWQRPRRQAREKNVKAVANWKRHSWPRFKKKPGTDEPSSSSSTRAVSP